MVEMNKSGSGNDDQQSTDFDSGKLVGQERANNRQSFDFDRFLDVLFQKRRRVFEKLAEFDKKNGSGQ